MSMSILNEEALTVLGIHARASNAAPQKIGDLWRRFHALGNQEAIPGRQGEAVYSVYCEYEGDFAKPYTVVIGCEVADDAVVPDGMKKVSIAPGDFAVFPVEGELPMSVFKTWAEIWETPLKRRYQADFDRYAEDGTVTIYVGAE